MSHFTEKAWKRFVTGTLESKDQRDMEEHLYECEACLADYLQANEQFSSFEVPESTAEQLDDLLQEMGITKTIDKKKKLIHPLWNYVIAASLTFILMSSGLFHHVSAWKEGEYGIAKKSSESFTESLMDQTLSFIDRLKTTRQEG